MMAALAVASAPIGARGVSGTASISGRVTVPAGVEPTWYKGVSVSALLANDANQYVAYVDVAADGTYSLTGLPAGSYKVEFWAGTYTVSGQKHELNLQTAYNGNSPTFAAAPVITLTDGANLTGVDGSLTYGGTISGRVTAPTSTSSDFSSFLTVRVFTDDQKFKMAPVNPDGTYSIAGLSSGSYAVYFMVGTATQNLVSEYYPNALSRASAVPVSVTAGGVTSGIDAELAQGATVQFTYTVPDGTSADTLNRLSLWLTNESTTISMRGNTSARTFTAKGVPAGTYEVSGSAPRPLADPLFGSRTVTVGGSGSVVSGGQVAFQSVDTAQVGSLTPARLADLAKVTPGAAPRCVNVAGDLGVPSNATGVFVNVTAASAAGPGNAVVYPDTAGNGATPPPNASSVNFEAGRDVANSAFVQLPANGDVCATVQGATLGRLILDVTGYVTGNYGVTLRTPKRTIDTREGGYNVGPIKGALVPGQARAVKVAGPGATPLGVDAVIANVTVTGVGGPGHLKVWPGDEARPSTSVVNYASGQDKANGQYLAVSPSGYVWIESVATRAHVIIDVLGYVTSSSPVVSTSPTRIVETRASEGIIGPISGRLQKQQVYSVSIPKTVVPDGATAVLMNVTAVQPESLGHLRVYPDSWNNGATPPPDTSTLNYIPGRDIPNMVMVQLPADRQVNFYSVSSTTDLVVDVIGYVKASS